MGIGSKFIGQEFDTKYGDKIVIVDYYSSHNVGAKFSSNGHITYTTMDQIRRGTVKNKSLPTVRGVGIVGEGEVEYKIYNTWCGILERAYCPKFKARNPTYKDVKVSKEWLEYRNFEKWFNKQVYFEGWDIDKDLLVKGNTLYNKNRCIFLPVELNQFIVRGKQRGGGSLPVGVVYDKRDDLYIAQMGLRNRTYSLGRFSNPKDAAICYKKAKETVAKTLAEEWKGVIDDKAYRALRRYTVDVNL